MQINPSSVLFLGKKDDEHCLRALRFCRANFARVTACLGAWGEPLPEEVRGWRGDYIVSYLSRWVVPQAVLATAAKAAINFHPASPDYPGIGCNNFALYENAAEYGVTCHHMAPKVDVGAIIRVLRFPVFLADDVAALLARTYDYQLVLFYEIAALLIQNKELPASQERWTRKPFTRKEFEALGKLNIEMPAEEIARRVRAIRYGNWQPTVELQGFIFRLKEDMKWK